MKLSNNNFNFSLITSQMNDNKNNIENSINKNIEKDVPNLKVLENLAFKTKLCHRNFDMISINESFTTDLEGSITLVRIEENLPPLQIGEFYINVFNFDIARTFNVDLLPLIYGHNKEGSYVDFIDLIKTSSKKSLIDLDTVNKIYYVNNFIIRPEFKKLGVVEEFAEFLYKNFYNVNNEILLLVKPFQSIKDDYKYFTTERWVENRMNLQSPDTEITLARDYYKLNKLLDYNDDLELNTYKLFAVASKCGFVRTIDDSFIFRFEPGKIIKRIKTKLKINRNKNLNL